MSSLRLLPVHPRAGGERSTATRTMPPAVGSSPRGRGTLPALQGHFCAFRFIPARAGNALVTVTLPGVWTVHPRAGGERSSRKYLEFLLFLSNDASTDCQSLTKGSRTYRPRNRLHRPRTVTAPNGGLAALANQVALTNSENAHPSRSTPTEGPFFARSHQESPPWPRHRLCCTG